MSPKCPKCRRAMECIAESTNAIKRISRLGFVCSKCHRYALKLIQPDGPPTVRWDHELVNDPADEIIGFMRRTANPPRPS